MSNLLLTNPIVFDTVGATSVIATGVVINSIVWDSGASGIAGDTVVLHDASGGNIIFQATLGLAKDTIFWNPPRPFYSTGLYLTTMGHGKLLVYTA